MLGGCTTSSKEMSGAKSPKSGRRPASRTSLSSIKEQLADDTVHGKLVSQRDMLLEKLAEAEYTNHGLRTELLDKEQAVSDLKAHLDNQKEEMRASSSLQSSIESTRGHLQKQLRQREADCNRLAVQLRDAESQLAQERIETHHLKGLLSAAKDKSERDKDALKKATRVQKQRAIRNEDALERAESRLSEQESLLSELADARTACDSLRKEASHLLAERSALKIRVSELEHIMTRFEEDAKVKIETTTARLYEKSSEASSALMNNDQLRVSLTNVEDKNHQLETELSQLRAQVGHYETLVDEYREQLDRSRKNSDDTINELEEQKNEVTRAKVIGECELEKVKTKMQTRLQELEPLPEQLKNTELRLQDMKEQLRATEIRNLESTKLIAELTSKVERQADMITATKQERLVTQEGCKTLEEKIGAMEKKVREMEDRNRELNASLAKKDESMHQINRRLDERARENDGLTRQVEAALAEARRHAEQAREATASKDRAAQTRMLDLETQLTQIRAENARLRKDKEEAEKKCNARLYDLRDRLEQSHASNRSMQNYVQFLKNSYASVFGDSGVAMTSSPVRNGFH